MAQMHPLLLRRDLPRVRSASPVGAHTNGAERWRGSSLKPFLAVAVEQLGEASVR